MASSPTATVLVVDNTNPPDYQTIQLALAAAAHGDTILVKYGTGTYVGQVRIKAKEEDKYYLYILGESYQGTLPKITFEGEDTGRRGAVEVYNNTAGADGCEDMRVTFAGFHVYGEDGVAAFVIKPEIEDKLEEYYTGVFIRDNILRTELNAIAAVQLGYKTAGHILYWQSVSWGEVTNNIIINEDGETGDGISAHHFVGTFANNRITSTSEGIHLGLGMLQPRHSGSPPDVADVTETLIEHNLFYHNVREGVHFTHGSVGTITNNIFVGKPLVSNNKGIYVGQTKTSDEDCDYECMSDSLDALVAQVDAEIYNNTFDRCKRAIVLWEPARVTLYNNIVARSGEGLSTYTYGNPTALTADYNLFWGNDEDYDPASLEGDHDVNCQDGNPCDPEFQGWVNVAQTEYSYMLQVGDEDDEECLYPAGTESNAIDRGHTHSDFYDQQPPGLEELRNDIGAFGGPEAIWDPTENEECFEYLNMPEF